MNSHTYTHTHTPQYTYMWGYAHTELQRYEGASTLYGPWTLAGTFCPLFILFILFIFFLLIIIITMMTVAYQQEFTKVAVALVTNTTLPHGPNPPDLRHNTVHIFPLLFFYLLVPLICSFFSKKINSNVGLRVMTRFF